MNQTNGNSKIATKLQSTNHSEISTSSSSAVTYDGKIAGLYDLEQTLGSGHFAVVKLARHVFTGEKVAVKVIDKSKLDDMSKTHLFQEVRCMKLVQHPNVVKLYEVIDTQTKLYLILELGDGGDLYDYIMKHESGLSEDQARNYFIQIVRAISYCHSLHVVHRDLKPENVVFFEKLGIVKLTDFGFSNKFCPGQKLETSCGSLAYSAPEILLGDSYDAPAVDIWSLGVILYMLVVGRPPFHEANDSETLTMIMDCKYNIPDHVSMDCKMLISRMLVREPEKRATLEEIANDRWVTLGSEAHDGLGPLGGALASKSALATAEKAAVLRRMVSAGLATDEQVIMDAVARGDYSHLTATYYLLAERKLKAKAGIDDDWNAAKRPEMLNVSRPTDLLAPPVARTPADLPGRSRKCSIVREEDDDEEESVCDTRRGSRSEGLIHSQPNVQITPPITKVKEGRRRAGSCSSSELSDDDSEARKRRSTERLDRPPSDLRRRDSHDDSSDSQERGAGGGGPGTRATSGARPTVGRAHSTGRGDGGGGDVRSGDSGAAGRRRRLRESRSLNRIAEAEEGRISLASLCRRPLLRLLRPHQPLQRSLC